MVADGPHYFKKSDCLDCGARTCLKTRELLWQGVILNRLCEVIKLR